MFAYETEALAKEAAGAETKAFSVETEAKTKTFSLEAEARPRRLKFQPRRDRAETPLRLETASRPRHQDRGHIPETKPTKVTINLRQKIRTLFVTGQQRNA